MRTPTFILCLRWFTAGAMLFSGVSLSCYGQTVGASPPAALASVTPGAEQLTIPIGDSSGIKVNFSNSPVQAIIPFYTQLTGRKMILDSSIQGETVRIIAPKPLSRKEAAGFIEATLLLNGFAVIPVDRDTVKLVHHSAGKSPSPEGLPVFNSIRDIPEGEQIVHFVMPLQNISPDEAAKAFQQVIKLHAYGAMTPVTNASSLIITENTATIRSIWDIAQVIDVPSAQIANEMIKLERSDADSVAEILKQIYEDKEKSDPVHPATAPGQNTPVIAKNVNAVPQPAAVSTADTNPAVPKVKVIPYRRTNQLLVIGRPVDITYIKGLVLKLDEQSDGLTFMKRKLRYVAAVDFLQVAYNAIARSTDIRADGKNGNAPTFENRGRRNSSSSNPNDSSIGMDGLSRTNNANGQNTNGSGTHRDVLSEPDQLSVPDSVVVGKTLLIAEPQSNSLIVSGSPEHIQIIDKLLNEMDVRPQQIYINTLIGHLNLDSQYKVGFDMLRLLDDFTLRSNRSLSSVSTSSDGSTSGTTISGSGFGTGSTTGSTTTTDGGAAPGILDLPFNLKGFNPSQLNLYGQLGALSRYVNLLDGNKNFKILSRPSVYTMNNRKAVISSGQRIAVPVSTLSNVGFNNTTASVTSNIEYRDVVLKLEVVPLINSDDEVTLRIAQVNDSVVGQQNISGNSIPTIGTQELTTTITVKNGSTVVLGGLITESDTKDSRGVPLLRRIPIIKYFFSTTERKKNREELLIFIQPNIIGAKERLDKPTFIEAGRSAVAEETLNFDSQRHRIPKALPVR